MNKLRWFIFKFAPFVLIAVAVICVMTLVYLILLVGILLQNLFPWTV
jgi:hypothetical protein